MTKPVEGAKRHGFKGFLKGTGKGIAGLVLKPVSGTLDAVSKMSEGVSNSIDKKHYKVYRVRPVRPFYTENKYMKEYNELDALGYEILYNYKEGKYAEGLVWVDSFDWKAKKSDKDPEEYFLLVIDLTHIFLINLSQQKVLWKIMVHNLAALGELTNGILLILHNKDPKLKVMIISSDTVFKVFLVES